MKIRFSSFIIIALLALTFSCGERKETKQKTTAKKEIKQKVKNKEEVKILEAEITENSRYLEGVFGIQELNVTASPDEVASITFESHEKVSDYDISPKGPVLVALIKSTKSSNDYLKFWDISNNEIIDKCVIPEGISVKALAYHPEATSIFIMGTKGNYYNIYRISKRKKEWQVDSIFSSEKKLRRLVVGPRPFVIDYNRESWQAIYSYRVFTGMDNGDNSYRIVSVTEDGKRFYQVVGPSETFTPWQELNSERDPSHLEADWALPISFHPGGHQLIWQDKEQFNIAEYNSDFWGESRAMGINLKNGTITRTPNGLGFIHWQKNIKGIGVYLLSTQKEEIQLSDYQFTSTPSSTPDGKGIVGQTIENGIYTLTYAPINVPLHDVVNAWMFNYSAEDIDLFQKNYGLFRDNKYDQIYKLYESENYYCNSYSRNTPTRPYLVTTDIFWELFGSAYQGLFIIKEQDEAIPSFWEMIAKANEYLIYQESESKWKGVINALIDYKNDNSSNPEVARIIEERDTYSDVIEDDFKYSNLKPRGHYTANDQTVKYFKAFNYFTTALKEDKETLEELNAFPDEVLNAAAKWINAYNGFIAPTNTPLVLDNIANKPPAYCQLPTEELSIFPLSWGFDNEILNSTVYQTKAPKEFQVTGESGPRLIPSGLDLASVLGNTFADKLLESDFNKYPPLRKVIDNLRDIYNTEKGKPEFTENIYNKWINAMAVQWMDTVHSTNNKKDNDIWNTKRIQTGLATWATLRHATILVNSTGAAECGEGGFEEILMRAPRGYVEPDPYTFSSIAELFDYAVKFANDSKSKLPKEAKEKIAVYDGVIVRLQEAAEEARIFKVMAEKERRGEMLNDEDNSKILYVARVAEHLFLVFNSIANENLGLAKPDPIAKIANVHGGKNSIPHLMVAVGNTMEWDHIVPFYGRQQIVKGSIYSYYEFTSNNLINDEEWRSQVGSKELMPWVKTYTSNQELSGVARTRY